MVYFLDIQDYPLSLESIRNHDNGTVNKIAIEWGKNYDTVFEAMPALLCMAIAIAKYVNGIYQMEKFKKMFTYIQKDNERLMNSPEHNVLENYMMKGRTFIIYFTLYLIACTVIYLSLPIGVMIYDELHPVNGTVVKELMYAVDYNVDPDKYFYLITFHSYLATLVTVAMIGALDTMYITLMQHACALLAVTGFRLKTVHILSTDTRKERRNFIDLGSKTYTPEEQKQIYDKLILGIKEHRNALEYTQLFQSVFSITLFIQLFINIICLSISGVLTVMRIGKLNDFVTVFIWTAGQLFHLFWLCLPGQNLMDYSQQLYYDTLGCMWYMLPKKSNLLYHFLLMNTMKSCELVTFKVMPLNMETYLSVTKAAMSYFTVLSSTR